MSELFLDFELPPELIAQHPAPRRDESRLLVVRRADQSLSHHVFRDLPDLLDPGDLLVLNDTRVLPARLLGRRAGTGGKWEGLYLGQTPDGKWEMLCQTGGRLVSGEVIEVEPGPLRLTLVERTPEGRWLVRPDLEETPAELLGRHGHVPLPPYIRKGRADAGDRDRYQTVYARDGASVAAPTAGLHFTDDLLEALGRRGIERSQLTLHVGLGTFQPVQTNDPREHHVLPEQAELPAETVDVIAACKARKRRVVAVGTTTTRVLEGVAAAGPLRPWSGPADLTIVHPFAFRVLDGLVTNFHLPRSSLLLLVGALLGPSLARVVYQTAIEHRYRFYSYGDAMLVL